MTVLWTRDDRRFAGALVATLAAMALLILAFPVGDPEQGAISGGSADPVMVHLTDDGVSASPLATGGDAPLGLMNMGSQEMTVLVDGADPSVRVPAGTMGTLDLSGLAPGQHVLMSVDPAGAVSSAQLTLLAR